MKQNDKKWQNDKSEHEKNQKKQNKIKLYQTNPHAEV